MSASGERGLVFRPWPHSTSLVAIGRRKASVLPEPGGACMSSCSSVYHIDPSRLQSLVQHVQFSATSKACALSPRSRVLRLRCQ